MQGDHTYWFMKETENVREYAIIFISMVVPFPTLLVFTMNIYCIYKSVGICQ